MGAPRKEGLGVIGDKRLAAATAFGCGQLPLAVSGVGWTRVAPAPAKRPSTGDSQPGRRAVGSRGSGRGGAGFSRHLGGYFSRLSSARSVVAMAYSCPAALIKAVEMIETSTVWPALVRRWVR